MWQSPRTPRGSFGRQVVLLVPLSAAGGPDIGVVDAAYTLRDTLFVRVDMPFSNGPIDAMVHPTTIEAYRAARWTGPAAVEFRW